MALIVETGKNVEDANSYVSVGEIRAYAQARGETLPVDDTPVEQAAIKAMDYIESKSYKGAQQFGLAFPRSGLYYSGSLFDSQSIPRSIKLAQIILTIAIAQGVNLMPTQNSRLVVRQKVGPLEREFENGAGASANPKVPLAEVYLRDFYAVGTFGQLRVIRA